MLDAALLRHLEPAQFYGQWAQTYFPTRPDGRQTSEYRPVSIQPGAVGTADGSALVRVGETTVMAGVKGEVSEASLGNPGRGYLIPNVHYAAGANASTRPGPPSDHVQTLTARLNDCLQSLALLDTASLWVEEGNLVWTLYLDLVVLNDAGNVWDALWLALTAALRDTLLPELQVDLGAGVVSVGQEAVHPLKMEADPVPFSYAYYGDADCFLVDPTDAETGLPSSILCNLLVDRARPETVLYSVQAPGKRPARTISPAEIRRYLPPTILDTQ